MARPAVIIGGMVIVGGLVWLLVKDADARLDEEINRAVDDVFPGPPITGQRDNDANRERSF